jgi:hypothetical protein
MSAAYGGIGPLQYEATAVFDFTPSKTEALDLNLLSDNVAGIGFDSLDVWSRHLLERANFESARVGSPGFADEFVWGKASEGFEPPGEVVGFDEVAQVRSQLVVGLVEVAFDGRILEGAVHSFDLPIIRYEIPRRRDVRLFLTRKWRPLATFPDAP